MHCKDKNGIIERLKRELAEKNAYIAELENSKYCYDVLNLKNNYTISDGTQIAPILSVFSTTFFCDPDKNCHFVFIL